MSAVLAALPDLPALVEPGTTLNGKRIRVPPRVNLGDLTPNNLGTVKKLHNVLFPVSYSAHFFDALLDPKLHPEQYNKLVFYQDLPVGVIVCRLEASDATVPRTLGEAAGNAKAEGEEPKLKDEGKAHEGGAYKLYIMTLGVLAPYRHQGLGSKLIHQALTAAAASHVPPTRSSTFSPSSSAAPTKPTPATTPGAKGKKPLPPAVAKKDAKEDKEAKEEPEPPLPRVESVYLHVQVGNDDARRFWEKWGFEVKDTVEDYYRKIEPRAAWLLERRIEPASGATA